MSLHKVSGAMRAGRCLLAALVLAYAAAVPLALWLATVDAGRYSTLKMLGCVAEGKSGGVEPAGGREGAFGAWARGTRCRLSRLLGVESGGCGVSGRGC